MAICCKLRSRPHRLSALRGLIPARCRRCLPSTRTIPIRSTPVHRSSISCRWLFCPHRSQEGGCRQLCADQKDDFAEVVNRLGSFSEPNKKPAYAFQSGKTWFREQLTKMDMVKLSSLFKIRLLPRGLGFRTIVHLDPTLYINHSDSYHLNRYLSNSQLSSSKPDTFEIGSPWV